MSSNIAVDLSFLDNIKPQSAKESKKEEKQQLNILKAVQKKRVEEEKRASKEEKDAAKLLRDDTKMKNNEKKNAHDPMGAAKIRFQINRYLNSEIFGDMLKKRGFKPPGVSVKKEEHLQLQLDQIRLEVGSMGAEEFFANKAIYMVSVLEALLEHVYDTPGLAAALANDRQFNLILHECLLEADIVYIKPLYRLLICVITTAVTCHEAGQIGSRRNQRILSPVSPVSDVDDVPYVRLKNKRKVRSDNWEPDDDNVSFLSPPPLKRQKPAGAIDEHPVSSDDD